MKNKIGKQEITRDMNLMKEARRYEREREKARIQENKLATKKEIERNSRKRLNKRDKTEDEKEYRLQK